MTDQAVNLPNWMTGDRHGCIACMRPCTMGLGIDGDRQWHADSLGALGVHVDQIVSTISNMPPGRSLRYVAACADCAEPMLPTGPCPLETSMTARW